MTSLQDTMNINTCILTLKEGQDYLKIWDDRSMKDL